MTKTKNNLIKNIISEHDWILNARRPFSLVQSSMLINSHYTNLDDGLLAKSERLLFLQEDKITRFYSPLNEIEARSEQILQFLIDYPSKLKKILLKGIDLNDKAKRILDGNTGFDSPESLVTLCDQLHALSILPRCILIVINNSNIKNDEIFSLCEYLRSFSYYYPLIDRVLIPLFAKELGLSSEIVGSCLTCREALRRYIGEISSRIKAKEKGYNFVLYSCVGSEYLVFLKNTSETIKRIEGKAEETKNLKQLTGLTASPGKVRGIARVVLSNYPEGFIFNSEEILVSIQGSPNLMSFIKLSAGMVTDEGGVACHGAILAREFNKPCVMGTKYATQVIKDGDLIEVDADNGIVRILK